MPGPSFIVSNLGGVLLALAGWCLLEREADAAVQVLTESFSPAVANFTDREIGIPQFDSALGTLQAVTIDLHGAGAFVQGFGHPGGGNRQLSTSHNLDLLLEQDSETLVSLSQSGNLPGTGGATGNSFGAHLQRVTLAGQKTLTSAQDLMQFTGCGLVDLFLSAQSGTGNHLPGGRDLHNGFWVLGGEVKVTYDYVAALPAVAVPEQPTGIAAGFAGLVTVCAVWLNRRRNKKGLANI